MEPDRPDDFDWVTARAQCSAYVKFRQLEAQARANAAQRNASLTEPERQRVSFHVERTADRSFAVVADNLDRFVTFTLDGAHLVVDGDGIALHLEATLTLTDTGACRWLVQGEILQAWQLLRRALESLFFDLR